MDSKDTTTTPLWSSLASKSVSGMEHSSAFRHQTENAMKMERSMRVTSSTKTESRVFSNTTSSQSNSFRSDHKLEFPIRSNMNDLMESFSAENSNINRHVQVTTSVKHHTSVFNGQTIDEEYVGVLPTTKLTNIEVLPTTKQTKMEVLPTTKQTNMEVLSTTNKTKSNTIKFPSSLKTTFSAFSKTTSQVSSNTVSNQSTMEMASFASAWLILDSLSGFPGVEDQPPQIHVSHYTSYSTFGDPEEDMANSEFDIQSPSKLPIAYEPARFITANQPIMSRLNVEYKNYVTKDGFAHSRGENEASFVRKAIKNIEGRAKTPHQSIMASMDRDSRMWRDLEVVAKSPVFLVMDSKQRHLQEAKFEIVSSEATYLSLLHTFEEHKDSLSMGGTLPKNEQANLCARMVQVRITSTQFFLDLETCWQNSIFLEGIFDVILHHVTENFHVYVKYCRMQARINSDCNSTLKGKKVCTPDKSLFSYLILPMQRVTRLPMLVAAVFTRLQPKDAEYKSCKRALEALRKLTEDCNEDVRNDERMKEMLSLSTQLVYPKGIKEFPLISVARWLEHSSKATLRWHEDKKKSINVSVYLFLFNDLLMIAKLKSEGKYKVQSYCKRNMAEILPVETTKFPAVPVKYATDAQDKYYFLINMHENHESALEKMVMCVDNVLERDQWFKDVPAILV